MQKAPSHCARLVWSLLVQCHHLLERLSDLVCVQPIGCLELKDESKIRLHQGRWRIELQIWIANAVDLTLILEGRSDYLKLGAAAASFCGRALTHACWYHLCPTASRGQREVPCSHALETKHVILSWISCFHISSALMAAENLNLPRCISSSKGMLLGPSPRSGSSTCIQMPPSPSSCASNFKPIPDEFPLHADQNSVPPI